MGQSAGKLVKRGYEYISSKGGAGDASTSSDIQLSGFKLAGTPFVLTRTSSLYFDEDGDLAHEFYQETCSKNSRSKFRLKRIKEGLRQQGEVKLKIPRLHRDFPVVMYEG